MNRIRRCINNYNMINAISILVGIKNSKHKNPAFNWCNHSSTPFISLVVSLMQSYRNVIVTKNCSSQGFSMPSIHYSIINALILQAQAIYEEHLHVMHIFILHDVRKKDREAPIHEALSVLTPGAMT